MQYYHKQWKNHESVDPKPNSENQMEAKMGEHNK